MKRAKGVPIAWVFPDSLADELGVTPGDLLLTIDGKCPQDYIDFVYLTSEEEFEMVIEKPDGEKWILDVERDPGEELGIQLKGIIYDELKECSNHCVFCFVHQMPQGLRHTLSLKDDDYRFSFLQGSFITLTNLTEEEIKRIKTLKLSPLYVSVHTTNPELRIRMMGSKAAGKIMEVLRDFKEAGIAFHTQIVLCPGLNDGEELKRSIEDLATLRPNLLSLAIVPVGLTKYRTKLFSLTSFTSLEAEKVFEVVSFYQHKYAITGENFIYLSDEFYLLTGNEFPPNEAYHDFPQLENGIGLSRLLLDEFQSLEHELPKQMLKLAKILFVTGYLGAKVLQKPVERLKQIIGLEVEILTVDNKFFGPKVTVAGLLTGKDIKEALVQAKADCYDFVVIPQVVLNDDDLFIDGLTRSEIIEAFPNAIFVESFYQVIDELVERNLMEVHL